VIAKIDYSIRKPALVQEIQLYAHIAGQNGLAATNHKSHDEQMNLVDEPVRRFNEPHPDARLYEKEDFVQRHHTLSSY
jgi:hypothetical protein